MIHENGCGVFYFNTPLDEYEFIQNIIGEIPNKIIDKYNLQDISQNLNVAVEISKDMYGLS